MNVSIQNHVQAIYTRGARWYDALIGGLALRKEARLRRRLVDRLALRLGDTVLDLACGTGLNFVAIEEAIGPTGRLVGVDLSPAMLAEAPKKVAAHGWANVTLIEADATTFRLAEPVDMALCTLAIGLMPDPDAVVRAMVGMVRPGGRVLIGDRRLVERWYGPLVNPLLRWVGNPWGAVSGARPLLERPSVGNPESPGRGLALRGVAGGNPLRRLGTAKGDIAIKRIDDYSDLPLQARHRIRLLMRRPIDIGRGALITGGSVR